MESIPKTFLGILLMTMTVFAVIGLTVAGVNAESARRYHDSIKAEIEESDLNGNIIDKCGRTAMDQGYTLIVQIRCTSPDSVDGNTTKGEVKTMVYNGDNGTITGTDGMISADVKKILGARSVDITLRYHINLPVFKHVYTKEIRDVA